MEARIMAAALCIAAAGAQAQLVRNDFTDNNDNSLTWSMRDTGWQTKAYWDGTATGVVHVAPGDNWGIGQVNSVTSEKGSHLAFSFDWTPAPSATGNALELDFQLIGWNTVGSPSSGSFFLGMNYNGKNVDTANGMLEKIDLIAGTSGGTSSGDFATGYHVIGQAGVTSHVEINMDLGDDTTGVTDISQLEYIGFRFAIDSDNDPGNVGGTIANVSLAPSGAPGPTPLASHDTGFTIMKVRSAQLGTNSAIVGASYEGTVIGMDYEGTMLWTNGLSGFMVHDVWCEDITGDGSDEVLIANADGHLYCLDGTTGANLWQFDPGQGAHLTPMYAVCVVKASGGTPYVVCGGFDKNAYYLNAAGQLVKTLVSSTYSVEKPWGDDAWVGYGHSVNFLRPIPQPDGSDHLAMNGSASHMQSSGSLYRFVPLANTPYDIDAIGLKTCGEMKVLGTNEFLFGSSALTDQYMGRIYPDTNTRTNLALTNLGTAGYRVNQPEIVSDQGNTVYFNLCGTHIQLVPLDLDAAGIETISGTYAYNDLWKDAQGRILLASAQSGGSCIHILDPSLPGWKGAFAALNPPGKIQAILANTAAVWGRLNTFSKPAWERQPLVVYLAPGEETHPVAQAIAASYSSPVFLNGYWNNGHNETTNWRTFFPLDNQYRTQLDTRNAYDRTQQQVLNSILPAFSGKKGIEFWGGHGNDPNYYSPGTLQKVLEGNGGKKTVMSWPEFSSTSDDFKWYLDHIMYPLAASCQTNNGTIYPKSKDIFWTGDVYVPLWSRLLSGEFADVFVSSMEETTDKTQDLSLAGRMGLWAAGSMDCWGMRTSRDNPSFDRSRQHSYQRLPNHFLRTTVYSAACGASYLGVTDIDSDYMSVYWQLIAKGALYVPKREEIVSWSPVHLSMTVPDERYLEEGHNNKWTVFYNQATENNNPMVFSHMNGSWPAAATTPWDYTTYATGARDRRQQFIPPYPNGIVLITPPQAGIFAAPGAPRGRMADHLHPMYRNILQEFITDGRNYLSADGATTYAANTYYTTVSNAIAAAAQQLPLTVSGEVGWVCAQTAPTHLRLTLVDGGYLNPKGQAVTVTFHTVAPVAITDVLDGTPFAPSGNTASIDVPLGLFRFIDIELAEPFFPDNGWGTYASDHGLSGNAAADYDLDGDSDLKEYALGGNPTNPAVRAQVPTLSYGGDDNVAFRNWQVASTNPGIAYIQEWTDDLVAGSWSGAWTGSAEVPTGDPDYVEAQHWTYGGTNNHLFFRLRINQP